MPIDINDENVFSLQEIEDKGKIYLNSVELNLQTFKIYLNQQLLTEYKGKEDEKIIDIRKKLGNQISSEAKFLMQNETKIEEEDEDGEDGFSISDIKKDNIIYIIDETKEKEKEIEKEKVKHKETKKK
jgi:hypothetical protein